jgi:ATP-dependent DNA helicase PIF1
MEENDKPTKAQIREFYDFKRITERKLRQHIPNYENLTTEQKYNALADGMRPQPQQILYSFKPNTNINFVYTKTNKKIPFTPSGTSIDIEELIQENIEYIEYLEELYHSQEVEANGERGLDKVVNVLRNAIQANAINPPINYELTPIKFSQALDIDGALLNKEWNTTKDACFFDYILNVVNNKKNLRIKKLKNIDDIIKYLLLNTEQVPLFIYETDKMSNIKYVNNEPIKIHELNKKTLLKHGVNIQLINNFCRNLKLNLNAIINGEVIEYKHTTDKNNVLYVFIENNHIYPITQANIINKFKRQKVVNAEYTNPKEHKKREYDKIIYNDDGYDYKTFLLEATEKNNKAPHTFNLYRKNDGIKMSPFSIDHTQYIQERECEETKEINNFIKTDILNELQPSYIAPKTLDFIYDTNLKNRTHIDISRDIEHYKNTTTEKININDLNEGKTTIGKDILYKVDINKAYRYSLENIEFFYRYDIDAEIIETNNTHGEGLYFIETEDNNLFVGNKWYSYEILKYAELHNIEYKIIYFLKNVKLIKNTLKDKINTLTEDDKKKLIINMLTGNFGILENNPIKAHTTQDQNKFFTYLHDPKYNYFDIIDKLYIYGKEKHILNSKNYIPIYIQILDAFNSHLLKTSEEIGGQVIGKFCDSLYILNGNPKPSKEIGGYKFEEIKEFKKRRKQPHSITKQFIKPNIKMSKYNDSTQADNIINEIMDNCGGLVTGDAGTGKSHIIKQFKIKYGDKVGVFAYTNKASLNIGGQTINSGFKLEEDNKGGVLFIKKDIIIIDEIGMVNSDIFKYFIQYKKNNPNTTFIFFGDNNQLPPIESLEEYDIFNNSNILNVVNNFKVNLTINHRATDKDTQDALNKIKNGNYEDITINYFNEYDGVHIVYYNTTRRNLNSKINIKKSKGKKCIVIVSNIDKPTYTDKQKEYFNKNNIEFLEVVNMKIYKGIELIALKALKNKNIVKNEIYKVEELETDKIKINGEFYTNEEISNNFTLSYAISVYKSQGQTYKQKVIIHDIKKLTQDKRFIYTASSRATNIKNISYCY